VAIGEDGSLWLNSGGEEKSTAFTFDRIFDEFSVQEDVYLALGQPLLDQAFAGYNGTIFACEAYV
jgi:hypothetical protein